MDELNLASAAVTVLAIIGALSAISLMIYFVYQAFKTSSVRPYFISGCVIILLFAFGALLIFLIDDRNNEAASSIFVGAFSTAGWIYTILFLRSTTPAHDTLDKKACVSNTIEIINRHMFDATLQSHIRKVRSVFPQGVAINAEQAHRLWAIIRAVNLDAPQDSEKNSMNGDLAESLKQYLNFMEYACMCYDFGLLDEKLFRSYFGIILPAAYLKFEQFLEQSAGAGRVSGGKAYIFLKRVAGQWNAEQVTSGADGKIKKSVT